MKAEALVHKCPRCKMKTTGTWSGVDKLKYTLLCPKCVEETLKAWKDVKNGVESAT